MRTRRSWRNQDRLWKELGGPPPKPLPVTVESLERQLANCHNKRTRGMIERELAKVRIREARKKGG